MKLLGRCVLVTLMLSILTSVAIHGASQPVTIRYANWQLLEQGRGGVLQKFFEQFQKEYPHIRIEPVPIAYSAYVNALTTQFEAGHGPDLFFVQDNALIPWISKGYLRPLDDLIDLKSYAKELPPQQSMGQAGGKTYAMIYEGFSYAGLIYNKSLLEKAGVSVPKTPEQLLAASEAVHKKLGKTGLIFPTDVSSLGYTSWGGLMLAYGFGARVVKGGKFTVDDPKFIQAADYMRKIYAMKSHPAGMEWGLQRQQFIAGDAAMCIDGCYWPATVKLNNPQVYSQLDVAPLPFPKKDNMFETNWYAVNANCPKERQEAVVEFLKFLYRIPIASEWALEGGVPGINSSYRVVSQVYPWFKVFSDAVKYGIPKPLPGYEQETAEIRNMLGDSLGSVITGRVPAKDAMKKLQTDLERRFAKK